MPQIQQYNAQISERGVAQGRSVTASDMGGGVGEAMAQFGAGSAKLTNQYAERLDQIEQRKGKLEAEKLFSDFRVRMAQENQALQDRATGTEDFTGQSLALYDKISGEFDKVTEGNQYAREHLQQRMMAGRDEFAIHNIGFEAALKAKKQKLDYEGIVNNYQNLVIADPSQYNQLKGEIRKTSELLNINPVVREELVRKNEESLAATAWNAIPEDSRAQLLVNGQQGGFDSAIKTVMRNEGGFVAVDGSSGAPAIFGINGKWHPEAYAKAKDIADNKGADAGKAYAAEFYKKEFWDKYNIGSLPANVQTIVMDGVVNHSSAFAGKLVEAARSESPDALIAMRLAEYRRLAEQAPGKYLESLPGWENRLKRVATSANGEIPVFSDLPPNEKLKAIESNNKFVTESVKTQTLLNSVEDGSILYSPKKMQKEAIDTHYDNFMASLGDIPNQQAIEQTVVYVQQHQIMPTRVESMVRGMIRSNNPDQLALAVDMTSRLKASNHRILDDLPADDLRIINTASSMMEAGYNPRAVAEKLTKLEDVPENIRQARLSEYKEIAKKDKGADYIAKAKDSFWSNDPDTVPSDMLAEFEETAQSEYQITGNMDAARRTALDTINRKWSVSYISGEAVFRKSAPEKIYGVQGLSAEENAKWIREQFLGEFSKTTLFSPDDKIKKIDMLVDPSSGEKPAYTAIVQTGSGFMQPVTFRPEWEASPAYKRMQTEEQKNMQEAIESRHKWLKGETHEGLLGDLEQIRKNNHGSVR